MFVAFDEGDLSFNSILEEDSCIDESRERLAYPPLPEHEESENVVQPPPKFAFLPQLIIGPANCFLQTASKSLTPRNAFIFRLRSKVYKQLLYISSFVMSAMFIPFILSAKRKAVADGSKESGQASSAIAITHYQPKRTKAGGEQACSASNDNAEAADGSANVACEC